MQIKILDHGYVELVEWWGRGRMDHEVVTDAEKGIIEAARQSTQGSFRGWDEDSKLLKYLYEHKHATPFEFAGMVIEVQAPIFVFREWHRHRTQSYNEMSARYSPLPDLYYMPDLGRMLAGRGETNKQAAAVADSIEPTEELAFQGQALLARAYKVCESTYRALLSGGMPKEVARCIMPVGHYSCMRASANLRNWLSFLTLRLAPEAQWEVRQYAKAVGECVAEAFPHTWSLFNAHTSST